MQGNPVFGYVQFRAALARPLKPQPAERLPFGSTTAIKSQGVRMKRRPLAVGRRQFRFHDVGTVEGTARARVSRSEQGGSRDERT